MPALAAVTTESQPCVWMCAGLISYRLCSRRFDCENCPLDAALRGELHERPRSLALHQVGDQPVVPNDRLYSGGHTWLQSVSDERATWRFGVDAFAATILGCAADVSWDEHERVCDAGEPICDIDLGLGVLPLRAPIRARVRRGNEQLRRDPTPLVTDPYHSGWILELEACAGADLDDLLSAPAAHRQAGLDLRRFRRNVAFQLLADVTSRTPRSPADALLTDLRTVVGGGRYVELLREFVH